MEKENFLQEVKTYITGLFDEYDDPRLVYHKLAHTEKVVSHVKEIATNYKSLSDLDIQVLVIAAWFHDAGYLMAEPALHEEKSVELMKAFMHANMDDDKLIRDIESCIMATKSGSEPTTILQQIIADADTYNLATDEFREANEQVYEEYTIRNGYLSSGDWDRQTIKLLERHRYYTSCCKDKLNNNKMENLKKIKERLDNDKQ